LEQGKISGAASPLHTSPELGSAVKAVAWCPFKSNVLATGGGNGDRRIRFWNRSNGKVTETIQTDAQISGLVWNSEYKELASSHGSPSNDVVLWKYPANSKITSLTGHSNRIINMIGSPDGTTIATLGTDETLRLWKCFAIDEMKKKKETSKKATYWDSLQTLR
jgi:cell division cycle protein 20 (cofactor of APC complex)